MYTHFTCPTVPCLQQVQRLEILAVDQQPVGLLVERPGVGERRQQPVPEVRIEMARVQHQMRVGLQERRARRLAIARDLVDGEQVHPLPALRVVGGDLRIERLGHAVQRHAPLRLQYKLLLEPEALLKILQLREEGDDLLRHVADGAHPRQRSAQPVRVARARSSRFRTSVFR